MAFALVGAFIVFVLIVGTIVGPQETASEPEIVVAETSASDIPREWQSAINKATDIANRDYSKEGTRRALTNAYDFPDDAAEYAVNTLDTDWQQNALNKANDLQARDYSHTQIERVLVTAYHFTPEEAEYAVTHLEP